MFRNAEIKSEIVDLRLEFQLKYAIKKIFICIFVSLFVFYAFIFIPAASPVISIARLPSANRFVIHLLGMAIAIPAFYGSHTTYLLKNRFGAPKAAASQCDSFQ